MPLIDLFESSKSLSSSITVDLWAKSVSSLLGTNHALVQYFAAAKEKFARAGKSFKTY